jgi:tRNA (adenine22-N1)-methyltransferase
MIKISKRLAAVASMVSHNGVLADVGTDHGYVPIYLLAQKKISRAIAMDVRSGPLSRAREHIADYGMDGYIQTRLSDGVAALEPGEADSILIAGMGGGLVMHILETGSAVCHSAKELILQPQSELARVRAYLFLRGYVTEMEDMVKEDGKYYPMMRVHYEGVRERTFPLSADFSELDEWLSQLTDEEEITGFIYGKRLLSEKNPVLRAYLEWEEGLLKDIWEGLKKQQPSAHIEKRNQSLKRQMQYNRMAQKQCGLDVSRTV